MASRPRSDTPDALSSADHRDGAEPRLLPVAALVLGTLAMALSPLFVRYANAETGPFASAFWRVLLALPVLWAWMRWEGAGPADGVPRDDGSARKGGIGGPAVLAGLAFAGDLLFWHLAILGTSVANATFFATTAPVFVVLISWLVLRRAVSGATWAGLAVCLGGGALLAAETVAVTPGRLRGDLFGVATAFFFALYMLALAAARRERGAARVTFWSSVVTAAVLLVAALVRDGDRFWPESAGGWAPLAGLAFVSQVAGQGLLAVALGRLPAVFSSLVILLEAVFAAGAAWLLLAEPVSAVQGAGGALILAGIVLARPKRSRAPNREDRTP